MLIDENHACIVGSEKPHIRYSLAESCFEHRIDSNLRKADKMKNLVMKNVTDRIKVLFLKRGGNCWKLSMMAVVVKREHEASSLVRFK